MTDFAVGVTSNLFAADGSPAFDFGIERLQGLDWRVVDAPAGELPAASLTGLDALLIEVPAAIGPGSFDAADRLAIVARLGVGYDNVDVAACTEHGTVVTITPDAVRRPMANAAITFVLMLSQHAVARHELTIAGRWDDRGGYVGIGLYERTLGIVGLGNIGREVARLGQAFGMRTIAADPFAEPTPGIEAVELDELLATADFVVVTAALTDTTRGLIGRDALAQMRPEAYLVNVARGPIVDQAALVDALRERRIAGAGLDVFEDEPIAPDDPLTTLDNVILTAHSLGWTDHCFRDCGLSAIGAVIDVAQGRRPQYAINREAYAHPRWQGSEL